MRKKIKKLHLYVALTFFLPLILQGLTGMILVFEGEISSYSLTKKSAENQHLILEIIDVAKVAAQKDSNPSFVKFDEAFVKIRFDKNSEIILDKNSLEVLQKNNPEKNFFYWVKKFHINLLIDKPWSPNIVGIFGIALLFLSISGIIIWWPKNLDKLRASLRFSFVEVGYKFHKEVHKSVGFWIFIVLTTSSFSGVYMVFKKSQIPVTITEKNTKILAIDEIVNHAKAAVDKDLELAAINFPNKSSQPFRLGFYQQNQTRDSSFVTSVFVDFYSGEVVEVLDPSRFEGLKKFLSLQHAIHTGKIFGMLGKILVFLAGATPLIFSITGIMLWWMKRKNVR